MKLPTLSNPLKLFAPALPGPALGMAGATGGHMMFASSGGGRGGYDDDEYGLDDDYLDDEPNDEPAPEEPQRRPRSTRTVRSGGAAGGATGGQTRVAQHQPEERYWTDYLRIALPVIGLLLMIGLLWFWATQLIGDTPDTTEPATEDIGLVSEGTPEPTQPAAQPTQETQGGTIGIGSTPADSGEEAQATEPASSGENQAEETTEEEPAAEETTGGTFASGDPVVVIEDGVNVRPSASVSGEPITTLNTGEELTILSGPVEAEDYVWWEVVLPDGSPGWVVEDFIEPAG